MNNAKNIDTLALDGGVLCFDFINTVNTRTQHFRVHEYLPDYQNFLLWCRKLNILDHEKLRTLAAYAQKNTAATKKALEKIKKTRENLYQLFSPIAAGQADKILPNVLKSFNADLQIAFSHLKFDITENYLQPTWETGRMPLMEPLWEVVKSAHDILIKKEYQRIKECPVCGWLFLDQTKNNKRRWCSPSTCGSIEKSKRYYRKKKKETV
jgi:predicted RNA-binding Zn ribbon-like protein